MAFNEEETRFHLIDPVLRKKGYDDLRVEFSWSGFDENDPMSGRGWMEVTGDEAQGRIFIHLGDDSGFAAIRAG